MTKERQFELVRAWKDVDGKQLVKDEIINEGLYIANLVNHPALKVSAKADGMIELFWREEYDYGKLLMLVSVYEREGKILYDGSITWLEEDTFKLWKFVKNKNNTVAFSFRGSELDYRKRPFYSDNGSELSNMIRYMKKWPRKSIKEKVGDAGRSVLSTCNKMFKRR